MLSSDDSKREITSYEDFESGKLYRTRAPAPMYSVIRGTKEVVGVDEDSILVFLGFYNDIPTMRTGNKILSFIHQGKKIYFECHQPNLSYYLVKVPT